MPTALHGILQFVTMTMLDHAGWNTTSEVRLKVRREAEPVPDVIAIKGKFNRRYPITAPDLCIEIMSPRDTLPDVSARLASTFFGELNASG